MDKTSSRTSIIRDIFLLATFGCAALSTAVLLFLTFNAQSLTDPNSRFNVELQDQEKISAYRTLVISVSSIVCGISLLAFLGSIFRSTWTIKFAIFLTTALILAEMGVFLYLLVCDPEMTQVSMTLAKSAEVRQRMDCATEEECQEKLLKELCGIDPKHYKYIAIGMAAFQAIIVILGIYVAASYSRKAKRTVYYHRYPATNIV
uniref:Uncharacterized protein n=1 Tax=Spongospora subterranea TaxID=70186 RepID=A0A0H5R5T4_9EUKA|eukprot:CRZ09515.1 hypothetical protein [Spongospora subterranea]